MNNKKGFTLMEILIAVGIIGVLSTVMMIVTNPGRQLAKARDTERRADLFAILSSIYQYSTEHSGELPDTDGDPATSNFPSSPTCIGTGGGCFNLAGAGEDDTIVPVYMSQMPMDPKTGNASDIGYLIWVDGNNHLHASASGETVDSITETR